LIAIGISALDHVAIAERLISLHAMDEFFGLEHATLQPWKVTPC
jgi:hypothetical protein